MFYDLSLPISNKIPTFPGTPEQKIEQLATIEKEGWNSKRVSFNSHYSTHIDAPSHMVLNSKTLDDYPIDKFVGDCVILNAKNMNIIDISVDNIRKGDIVFIYTGQTDKIYTTEYFANAPVLSPAFAEKLVAKKISIIGLDCASPDAEPYALHPLFLKNDILIVENLTNLEKLSGKRMKCYIAPLKIENADGAPCRVIVEDK